MPEIIRARDCIVFFMKDVYPVAVSQAMVDLGWPGGQGVRWDASSVDERIVTFSNGLHGGILIWGSDETGDQHTAMTGQFRRYRYATFLAGGALLATSTYERYTYASRTGGGPLVPLVYQPNAPLYFSLRGYWTLEDEPALASLPHAPSTYAGFVAQVPKAVNNQFLGVQSTL